MSRTLFVTSRDGTRIAYDVSGNGPSLVLLHGFSNNRTMIWHELGWVDRLSSQFRVITVDLRGCGESDTYDDPAHYTATRHLEDVLAVADACDASDFRLWGWSFGATIGTHLASRSDRVTRAVIAGTYFGPLYTSERVNGWVAHTEMLARAKAEGRLDDLTPGERDLAARTDLTVLSARYRALLGWPQVEPKELRCSTLVYSGTRDGRIVAALNQQQPDIEAAGLTLQLFDDLDHAGLVTAVKVIQPHVLSFLGE